MPEETGPRVSSLVRQVLEWEGDELSAGRWATANAAAIKSELESEDGGIVKDALNSLVELASSEAHAEVWDLSDLLGNVKVCELAAAAVQQLFSFLGAVARRIHRGFQSLMVIFRRYDDLLFQLARLLRATGFSIGVGIPGGFTFALNFDFVQPGYADPFEIQVWIEALAKGQPALERLKRGMKSGYLPA